MTPVEALEPVMGWRRMEAPRARLGTTAAALPPPVLQFTIYEVRSSRMKRTAMRRRGTEVLVELYVPLEDRHWRLARGLMNRGTVLK